MRPGRVTVALAALSLGACASSGGSGDETVVDINTPLGQIEIARRGGQPPASEEQEQTAAATDIEAENPDQQLSMRALPEAPIYQIHAGDDVYIVPASALGDLPIDDAPAVDTADGEAGETAGGTGVDASLPPAAQEEPGYDPECLDEAVRIYEADPWVCRYAVEPEEEISEAENAEIDAAIAELAEIERLDALLDANDRIDPALREALRGQTPEERERIRNAPLTIVPEPWED